MAPVLLVVREVFRLTVRRVSPLVTRLPIPLVLRVIILLLTLPIFLPAQGTVFPLVTLLSLRALRVCPVASRFPRFIT